MSESLKQTPTGLVCAVYAWRANCTPAPALRKIRQDLISTPLIVLCAEFGCKHEIPGLQKILI
jgi:hypothetical protein